MANNAIETVMGAVVLTVAGGFLYFAYSNSSVKPIEGYALSAAFSNISGISSGSDVRVGGIKIGVVEQMNLDPKTYQAITTLRIRGDVKLPKDSSAAIHSPGLLGDKFIDIEPGGDTQELANGDKITFTQPAVSIEELVGKFVFSGGGADKGKAAASTNASEPGAAAPAAKDSAVSSGIE